MSGKSIIQKILGHPRLRVVGQEELLRSCSIAALSVTTDIYTHLFISCRAVIKNLDLPKKRSNCSELIQMLQEFVKTLEQILTMCVHQYGVEGMVRIAEMVARASLSPLVHGEIQPSLQREAIWRSFDENQRIWVRVLVALIQKPLEFFLFADRTIRLTEEVQLKLNQDLLEILNREMSNARGWVQTDCVEKKRKRCDQERDANEAGAAKIARHGEPLEQPVYTLLDRALFPASGAAYSVDGAEDSGFFVMRRLLDVAAQLIRSPQKRSGRLLTDVEGQRLKMAGQLFQSLEELSGMLRRTTETMLKSHVARASTHGENGSTTVSGGGHETADGGGTSAPSLVREGDAFVVFTAGRTDAAGGSTPRTP